MSELVDGEVALAVCGVGGEVEVVDEGGIESVLGLVVLLPRLVTDTVTGGSDECGRRWDEGRGVDSGDHSMRGATNSKRASMLKRGRGERCMSSWTGHRQVMSAG